MMATDTSRMERRIVGGVGAPDAGRLQAWRQQFLLASLILLSCASLMGLMAMLGHADRTAVTIVAPLMVMHPVLAWVAAERGWSWHLDDPALTEAQIAYTIVISAVCYALAGPLRTLMFMMVYLAVVFGIFALRARAVRRLTVLAIAVFGPTMAVMSQLQPHRYPPADEGVIFLAFCVAMVPLSLLSARMGDLRAKLGRQKAELQEALARIQDMAMRDELTGLFNRRRLAEVLREVERMSEDGRGCCVALLDLDHFKRVNDVHGHAVGDAVLRRFALTLHDAVLGGDKVGRWGGEEFMAVLATNSVEHASAAARRILEATRRAPLPLPGGGELAFTVSIGLAVHRPGEPIEQTVERADQALYAAKQQGRDRVAVAPT